MDEMVCYCGHDCGRCVTYRATVEDSAALREQALRFYRNEFGFVAAVHVPKRFFISARRVHG